LGVSRGGEWTEWCRFFLEAVIEQAEDNLKKVSAILSLYVDMKTKMAESTIDKLVC
jgi:hypothetical protein